MKMKFGNITDYFMTINWQSDRETILNSSSSWMKEYKTKTDPRSWHLWKLSEVTYSTIIFFKCTASSSHLFQNTELNKSEF